MQGEELGRGEVLLQAGTRLTAAGIGLLATAGCELVKVVPPQKVGVIVTGSEILELGKALEAGQIFDSNSYTIRAALNQAGIVPVFVQHAQDDRTEIISKLRDGLAGSDMLLVTGGVSVGDFDFVKDAAQELGLETLLWKVRQKPGKPLFVGATPDRRKLLFGLPGNPASALVCLYEYALPALLKSMGANDPELPRLRVPLSGDFRKNASLTHFLKGRIQSSGSVEILEQQGSHMLTSFARANCLVVIPEEITEVNSGDIVEVHLLPV
jgi:molybdopterin molybdotransferase